MMLQPAPVWRFRPAIRPGAAVGGCPADNRAYGFGAERAISRCAAAGTRQRRPAGLRRSAGV